MVITTVINSNYYDNNWLGCYMFAHYQEISEDDTLTLQSGLKFQAT